MMHRVCAGAFRTAQVVARCRARNAVKIASTVSSVCSRKFSTKNDHVRIFDTTLRDGEQSPGATMTSNEKVDVAHALAELGVSIMEVGFPAASPDDLQAVQRISAEVGGSPSSPSICALARASKTDIDKAWEGVRMAANPRIHVFLATSPIHMKHKLRMSPEQVLHRITEMISYAHSICPDIEFSPEDAGRSDPAFLYHCLEAAIKAGATTLNIPDTVGYTTPLEYGDLIKRIVQNTPGIDKCYVSTHCHDDLGLATANTLAGVAAGARQVEVTVNGIGERAGNAALEEVVMALHTRRPLFGLSTGVDTTKLSRVSRLVSKYTGIMVQPNKAIVGANAFAHESGIHQDGMLKHAQTYEIMRPETVGVTQTNLVLGKHSGRHALKSRLQQLGFSNLTDQQVQKAFKKFKALADKKKHIQDADLETIMSDEIHRPQEVFYLDGLQVSAGTMGMPTATVRIKGPDGKAHMHAAIGTGPVDAAFKAIDTIVKAPNTLLEFNIQGVTEGIDAIGRVTVRITPGADAEHDRTEPQTEVKHARTFNGYGTDTDIVVASCKAYLSAVNKLLIYEGQKKPVFATNTTDTK